MLLKIHAKNKTRKSLVQEQNAIKNFFVKKKSHQPIVNGKEPKYRLG